MTHARLALILQPDGAAPHDIEAPRTHQGLRPWPSTWDSRSDSYRSVVLVPWLVRLGPVARPVVAKLWFDADLPYPDDIVEHWKYQLRQHGYRPQFGIGNDELQIYDVDWIARVSTRAMYDTALSDEGERLRLPSAKVER